MNYCTLNKVVMLFLMALYLPVQESAASELQPLQDLVRKSFADDGSGPGFFMRSKIVNHVEVCGDHCSYFEWSGDGNDEKFWKFIVLYELQDGPGADVKAFSQNVKAMTGHELIENKFCSIKGDDISTISCNWKSYSKSLKMRVGYSNYDEGFRCYAEIIEWGKKTLAKQKCSPINPKESPFK